MARKPAPAFQAPRDEVEPSTSDPVPATVETRPKRRRLAPENVPANRRGRQHFGAWVSARASRQFKVMAIEEGITVQEAFVRMLNREFARMGLPEIAE